MLIEPADLTRSLVAEHVAQSWGLAAAQIDYAPVGFGSHHWWLRADDGQRWFATVDDLRMGDRSKDTLVAALTAAAALRQAGHGFVVAPVAKPDGGLTKWLPPHYVLAVYPHVDGQTATYGRYESHEDRRAVVERLAVVHRSIDLVRDMAPVDDLRVPKRSELEDSLHMLTEPWSSGPFSGLAQALLTEHEPALRAALTNYDECVDVVAMTREQWVITHGEPHRGNTIVNDDGVQLIDWESARIAPRERDLWALVDEDGRSGIDYTAASGHQLDAKALNLYRRWWSLCEVSLYTDDLRRVHDDTPETQIAWHGLVEHLALAAQHRRPAS